MLSRKYYKMIARVIKDNSIHHSKPYKSTINRDSLIVDLCIILKKDNTLFNSDTFRNACRIK